MIRRRNVGSSCSLAETPVAPVCCPLDEACNCGQIFRVPGKAGPYSRQQPPRHADLYGSRELHLMVTEIGGQA